MGALGHGIRVIAANPQTRTGSAEPSGSVPCTINQSAALKAPEARVTTNQTVVNINIFLNLLVFMIATPSFMFLCLKV